MDWLTVYVLLCCCLLIWAKCGYLRSSYFVNRDVIVTCHTGRSISYVCCDRLRRCWRRCPVCTSSWLTAGCRSSYSSEAHPGRSPSCCCVLVQTTTTIITSTALYMYMYMYHLCKVLKQRTRTVYMSTCTMCCLHVDQVFCVFQIRRARLCQAEVVAKRRRQDDITVSTDGHSTWRGEAGGAWPSPQTRAHEAENQGA